MESKQSTFEKLEIFCSNCKHNYIKYNEDANCPFCSNLSVCSNLDCNLCNLNRLSNNFNMELYSQINTYCAETIHYQRQKPIWIKCKNCNDIYFVDICDAVQYQNNACQIHQIQHSNLYESELVVLRWCIENNFNVKHNIRFEFSGHYSFDIYFEDLNIICEIDGDQHFEFVPRFKSTIEFQMNRDIEKMNLLLENEIKIIRLSNLKSKISNHEQFWDLKLQCALTMLQDTSRNINIVYTDADYIPMCNILNGHMLLISPEGDELNFNNLHNFQIKKSLMRKRTRKTKTEISNGPKSNLFVDILSFFEHTCGAQPCDESMFVTILTLQNENDTRNEIDVYIEENRYNCKYFKISDIPNCMFQFDEITSQFGIVCVDDTQIFSDWLNLPSSSFWLQHLSRQNSEEFPIIFHDLFFNDEFYLFQCPFCNHEFQYRLKFLAAFPIHSCIFCRKNRPRKCKIDNCQNC